MRAFRGRRTSYRLIFLFFVAAFVYMMFQFFSINILSIHNKMLQKHEKRKYLPQSNLDAKKRQNNMQNVEQNNMHINKNSHPKDNVVGKMHHPKKYAEHRTKAVFHRTQPTMHHNQDFNSFSRSMHGVHPELQIQYKDIIGLFQCLHSKERIPGDRVNDDYCDCHDGTDEPGTSACQDNRFYCAMQIDDGMSLKTISASFVNDGICDCCDGSDEWQGKLVPENIRIENPSRKYPVSHAPCKNTCHEAQEKALKFQNMKKMAARLKQEYIKEAQNNYFHTDKKFGQQGEFYKLSHNCFDISHSGFEYNVCPFVKVTQTENNRNEKNLGRDAVTWLTENQMKMGDGDSLQCPGAIKRSSIITFECGLEDKLLNVRESSICEYSFTMTTPAAC